MSENQMTVREDQEIDLMNIVEYMKKKWKIYVTLMLLFAVIGLAVMLFMNEHTKPNANARSIISVKYVNEDAEDGEDGYDLNGLTSAYVLQRAVNKAGLGDRISGNQVSGNISINRIATEEYRQLLALYGELKDTTIDSIESLANIEAKYEDTYIVDLRNGFGIKKKIYLTDEEMKHLLNSLMEVYSEQFITTYSTFTYPTDERTGVEYSQVEEGQAINQIRQSFNHLKTYCDDMNAAYPKYTHNSLTYGDVSELISTIIDVQATSKEARLYYSKTVSDKSYLQALYQYYIDTYNRSLDQTNKDLQYYSNLIEDFENENYLVLVSGSESDIQRYQKNMDYYNDLVIRQSNFLSSKSWYEKVIADYEDRLENLKDKRNATGNATTSAEELLEVYSDIYDEVHAMSAGLLSSSGFKGSFIDTSTAFLEAKGFFSADAIKKDLIGFAGGAFLGLVIWCMYGLGAELNRGRKETV